MSKLPYDDFESLKDLRARWYEWVEYVLNEIGYVVEVNRLVITPGRIVISMDTNTISKENLESINYYQVLMFADAIAAMSYDDRRNLTGTDDLVWDLTTYTTDGDCYRSETSYRTIVQLSRNNITYTEWAQAANGRFCS